MLRLTPVALAGLVLVAGCFGPEVRDDTVVDTDSNSSSSPGASYTLITVTGVLAESGPEYTRPDTCGEDASVVAWDVVTKDLWLAEQATNWGRGTSPLLIVSSVEAQLMRPDGCAGRQEPVAAHNHSFALPYWWAQPPLPMEWDGQTWSVSGTPLPPGATLTVEVTSSHHKGRDGYFAAEYTYQGNVTFRNEGVWPHAKVHVVENGWDECCPPVAPPVAPPPAPPPVLYHVLAVKATLSRDPPAASPTGPQPNAGACITPYGISIDAANGTAYVVEDYHPVDPATTRLIVHEARGGRSNCNADQAWVVTGSDTWRVRVSGGEFTFPISEAPWANGTFVSGRLLRDNGTAEDRELRLQRSLESDGVRWTVDAEFRLLGPWSMADLHELPTDEAPPYTAMWATWRTS